MHTAPVGRPRTPVIQSLSTYAKRYISPIQLAEYIGVSRRTIYHHIDKGALRVVRIGGVIRIRIDIAREYVAE